MELLPNHSGNDRQDIMPYADPMIIDGTRAYGPFQSQPSAEAGEPAVNIGRLVRKYWLVLIGFLLLGAAGGFTTVVLSSPEYKARLLLEVQPVSNMFTKGGSYDFSGSDSEVNIQTQINILSSDTFRKRGTERLQQDAVPLAPMGRDIFSRLRQRIHPATQDPIENAKQGLADAYATFVARPVNHTRLIELTCESVSPEMAAQFLNSMAAEFVDDSSRSRLQNAQKTSEWLAAEIEETKSKMQEAEEHLREFITASGNIFAGQDSATLEDTKLGQLKGELAKIQAERIAKQTRYELTLKYRPEELAEVLDDIALRGLQQKIAALRQDRAALEIKYTAKHQKVRELDAQLAEVERDYQNEIRSVITRIKNDYEALASQEKLLSADYTRQSQRVSSQAGKAAQYSALKREAETLHQVYQSLLMQQSEAGLSSSVPVSPIRLVEASTPPAFPYRPRPVLNISMGCLLGFVLAGAVVFLRERMDHSINAPGVSRRLFNTPELGVIPNLHANGNGIGAWHLPGSGTLALNGEGEDAAAALVTWQSGPSFISESFRSTLASILRNQTSGREQKLILITSPGPSEGKTTVVQNLGIALAEIGRRVLLVDADFRRPHLHRKFGLSNEWGLTDILSEDEPLSSYAPDRLGVATGFPGLHVLTNGSGTDVINVSRQLYSPRLREVLKTLSKQYDMILVDAPPILHVADARIIAPLTDALILVLRCGVTDRASATEAYQRIQEDGLTLLGTVLTDYDLSSDRKRQYYYDYGDAGRV